MKLAYRKTCDRCGLCCSRETQAFQIGYRQATRESVAFIRTWKIACPNTTLPQLGEAYFNLLFEGMAKQLTQLSEKNIVFITSKIGGNT